MVNVIHLLIMFVQLHIFLSSSQIGFISNKRDNKVLLNKIWRSRSVDSFSICLGVIRGNILWSSMDELRNCWKKECLLILLRIDVLSLWRDTFSGMLKNNLSLLDLKKGIISWLLASILMKMKLSYLQRMLLHN